MFLRELFIQACVPVTGCKPGQGGSHRHILVNSHFLAVRCEHGRVVVVICHPDLDVCCIHVGGVRVAHKHGEVEEWVYQGVVVHWL